MTEQSKLEWTEYKSRFRAVTSYGTYWIEANQTGAGFKLICGTTPCWAVFSAPEEAQNYAQAIHDRPSIIKQWFDLSDVPQSTYNAPTDLPELLRTYETLLAGDNLPERIAVQTVDLRALLNAAQNTHSPISMIVRDGVVNIKASPDAPEMRISDHPIYFKDGQAYFRVATTSAPHLSAPCAVEVKKLQWDQDWAYGLDLWKSQGYEISRSHGEIYFLKGNGISPQNFNTLQCAKAAAQADFERRILSCVVAKPVAVADAEAKHEKEITEVITERDQAEAWADKLAQAIGGEAVGEHSNMNNPWANALEIAESAKPVDVAAVPSHLKDALKASLAFVEGFDGDEMQERIPELIEKLTNALSAEPAQAGHWQDISSFGERELGRLIVVGAFDGKGKLCATVRRLQQPIGCHSNSPASLKKAMRLKWEPTHFMELTAPRSTNPSVSLTNNDQSSPCCTHCNGKGEVQRPDNEFLTPCPECAPTSEADK